MKGIVVISEIDESKKIFIEEHDLLISPFLDRVEVIRMFPGLGMYKKTDYEIELPAQVENLIITHFKSRSALNSWGKTIGEIMVKAEVEARMGEKIPD